MDFSTSILGKTAVDSLQSRLATAVLVIGSDHFTRHDLSQVDCFNFIAAANLNVVLKELTVKNTKDLYTNYPPSTLALPGIGVIALAVIGAAFEAKHIGGEHPLESWMARHSSTNAAGIHTFTTLKRKEQQNVAVERTALKKRKRQRRNQAHQIRTKRFLAANEAATLTAKES